VEAVLPQREPERAADQAGADDGDLLDQDSYFTTKTREHEDEKKSFGVRSWQSMTLALLHCRVSRMLEMNS
jgi:hypothetical protein